MSTLYNEDYFEQGIQKGLSCYENYRWIPELTIPFAHHIIEYLNIDTIDTILDFGCAKGYLVKAFHLLGRVDTWGYDISEYAISEAPHEVQSYVSTNLLVLPCEYDYIICKDVLEHIPYSEIEDSIKLLFSLSRKCFVIVPLAESGKYVIPSFENDATHIIREDLQWWANVFQRVGYIVTKMTYRARGMKENYSKYEYGNGFFTLKRR